MLYINGEWLDIKSKEMDIVNPATGELIQRITVGGQKETHKAIKSAKKAFEYWKDTTGEERGFYLSKVASLMTERREELAEIITMENGKPFSDSLNEVNGAISYVKWYAEEAKRIYSDVIPGSQTEKHLMVLKKPIGVCAAITHWNFPLSMITRKLAPAIAAGCTSVLKPAAMTPLSAIEMFKCLHDANLPKGVLNLVIGSAQEIGDEMTSNPDVRKITFTGSTPVGKHIFKNSADTLKRASMELGGHAPFIVFEDADIDAAIKGVMASKFKNSGQTCISTNRIYVSEDIADEFAYKLAQKVEKLKVGNGMDEDTDVGPLINQDALNNMHNQINDAINNNGKVICGGEEYSLEDREGYFYKPTVIQDANDDMLIATEETFGPIAPIFTFQTEEDVVNKANHSKYGLAAYCFTNNLGRGHRMIKNLDYGIVGINDPSPIVPQAPFGGFKESGMGKEGGKYGLEEYLEEKYVSILTT